MQRFASRHSFSSVAASDDFSTIASFANSSAKAEMSDKSTEIILRTKSIAVRALQNTKAGEAQLVEVTSRLAVTADLLVAQKKFLYLDQPVRCCTRTCVGFQT